jgi:hypothetical protein
VQRGEQVGSNVGFLGVEWFKRRVLEVDAMVAEKAKNPEVPAQDLTVESVKTYNETMLRSYGPNKSNVHKLRQLERHERLHYNFTNGMLSLCSLSYYLHYMEAQRKELLRSLRDGVHSDLQVPTRLAKFPAGKQVLADKGFAITASKYPNFNAQITPHFLSSREQFQKGEIEVDRGVCTLRYTSEVVFTQIFNENALKDSIPYSFFSILKDSIRTLSQY